MQRDPPESGETLAGASPTTRPSRRAGHRVPAVLGGANLTLPAPARERLSDRQATSPEIEVMHP